MADHNISIDVSISAAKAVQELKSIRSDLDDIKKYSHLNVSISANTANAVKSINELRRELAQFAALGAEMNTANIEFLDEKFQALIDKIDAANTKTVDLDVESGSVDDAISKTERLVGVLETASSVAGSLSSVFSALGDFGGMFADSFGAMSGMFKFDALGTSKRYLTAMATRAVTGQIGGILERYDIMNTFVPYMELAGVDAATAQASLDAVDLSIRGIPIGLDEAAFRLRKYQMYLGDIEKATQFTIGIQKAITAGGASEQMKTTAYTQIDRLLATGKLGQSRQWLSLFNGMGVSLKFLKEELALDPTADLKTVAADLANGTIATEDFIDAIARLSENPGLDRAIGIYKGTIEAWQSNINNAIKRGGQNILENVNAVLEDIYGQGITGFMKNVRDGIDTVSKDAGNYIKENPQNIQTIGDAIGGLIDKFTSLDGGRFVENLVGHISGIADGVSRIFSALPPNFIEDFTAFATTWAGPMATLMTAAQSGLGVVLGVFERMKDFDMPGLMEKISEQVWNMADAVAWLLGQIPDGVLGDLMAFALVWGRPLATVLGAVSGALKDIATVISAGGAFSAANGVVGQITALAMSHPLISAAALAIGSLAAAFEMYWQAIQAADLENLETNVGDISELVSQTDSLITNSAKASEQWSGNIESFTEKAEQAHEAVKKIEELNQQIEELSKPLPYSTMDETRDELLAERIGQIEKLASLFPDLRLEVDETTGALTEQSKVMLSQADAYIDYMTGVSLAQAYRQGIEGETGNIVNLRNERDSLVERQSIARDYLRRINGEVRYYQQQMNAMRAEAEENAWNIIDMPGYSELSTKIADAQRAQTLAKGALVTINGEIRDVDDAIQKSYDTIEKYGRNLSELRAQQVKYSGTEWWFNGEKTALEDLDENLQNIIADYELLKEEATEAFRSAIGGFEKIEDVQPQALSTTTGNVEANNKKGQYYQDQLGILQDWIDQQLLTEEGRKFLEENGEAIQQLIDQAQSDFGDRGLLYGLVDAITGGDQEALNEYFTSQLEQSGITDTVGGLIADIEAMLKYGSEWKKFRDENAEEDEFAWMKQGIQDNVITPLVDMAQELSDSGETGAAIIESVDSMANGIIQAVEPITEGFDGATDAAHIFEAAVTNAASTANSKAGEMGSLIGSLQGVASAAANAFSNVSALAGAISRLQDKTINIRVNVSAGLGHLANGGMAGFFASGGNVTAGFPGMATGTDIIPAWLTPGEFVMRRAAVGLFGSRFMNRVNKMDIGGAFDALMSRISNPMNLRGATYNRDNHATVNNYFYGDNGQNYSQRKAYRYVGAL